MAELTRSDFSDCKELLSAIDESRIVVDGEDVEALRDCVVALSCLADSTGGARVFVKTNFGPDVLEVWKRTPREIQSRLFDKATTTFRFASGFASSKPTTCAHFCAECGRQVDDSDPHAVMSCPDHPRAVIDSAPVSKS